MKTVTNKGKQSTRDTILHALKSSNQATVEALAEIANVSPVTVRHHLNSLQADGLIEVDSVRRKVGRPYYVYSLSESGHELFPHKYVRLTNRLLDELKATLPPEQVNQLFQGVVQSILEEHKGDLKRCPLRNVYLIWFPCFRKRDFWSNGKRRTAVTHLQNMAAPTTPSAKNTPKSVAWINHSWLPSYKRLSNSTPVCCKETNAASSPFHRQRPFHKPITRIEKW